MLQSKHLMFSAITLALLCSAVDAQFKIEQVAKLSNPLEESLRFRGGREVVFTDDETKMAVGFYGSTVQFFDLKNNVAIGEPIRTSGDGEIGFVNNDIAYTADWDSVSLWDVSSGQQIGNTLPHMLREDSVIHPAVGQQGRYMATRVTMKSVQLWDVLARKQIGIPLEYSSQVHSMRFSNDGETLIVRAGGFIYAIDSETGNEVAGPLAAGWLFKHFPDQQKLVTTEQVGEGFHQLVVRSTDREGWPEFHRSDLPGRLKRIIALDDDQVLLQASKEDYTPAMFIVSLENPGRRTKIESDADRAFGVIVPEDQKYWICSNIQNISCQEFGQSEPVWQKQVPRSGYDQHLRALNNEYFIIRDKNENFGIYKIADGSEVWKQAGVKRFFQTKNIIALCNEDGIEIWAME